MSVRLGLKKIQGDPRSVLSASCSLSLGAFLVGYRAVDSGLGPVLAALDDDVSGPDEARGWTRAYLSSRTEEEGLQKVLGALLRILGSDASWRPSPGPGAQSSFVSFVRESIEQGRPGMVLAEPTLGYLFDFSQGYGYGLDAVNPDLASAQRGRLAAFELWLQKQYSCSQAPWYGIVRVCEGACERGLLRFLQLWDEFEREVCGC